MSVSDTWRDLPSIAWISTLDAICFCKNCMQDGSMCSYCGELHRETTVRTSAVWAGAPELKRELVVLVREWHDPDCKRLIGLDDGVWRVDLAPVANDDLATSFERVSTARILEIDTGQWPGSQWVYRAYGPWRHGLFYGLQDESLLYVGVTGNVRQRMRQHRGTSDWWSHCAYVVLERHPDRISALAAESESIRTERPHFNVKDQA